MSTASSTRLRNHSRHSNAGRFKSLNFRRVHDQPDSDSAVESTKITRYSVPVLKLILLLPISLNTITRPARGLSAGRSRTD